MDVTVFNKVLIDFRSTWNVKICIVCQTHIITFSPRIIFSNDDIHLSHSGIKRLLDAMNTTTKIVVDYELCVFSNLKTQSQSSHTGYSRRRNRRPQNKPYKPNRNAEGSGAKDASGYRNSRKQCLGCNMVGHILAESWNVK